MNLEKQNKSWEKQRNFGNTMNLEKHNELENYKGTWETQWISGNAMDLVKNSESWETQ